MLAWDEREIEYTRSQINNTISKLKTAPFTKTKRPGRNTTESERRKRSSRSSSSRSSPPRLSIQSPRTTKQSSWLCQRTHESSSRCCDGSWWWFARRHARHELRKQSALSRSWTRSATSFRRSKCQNLHTRPTCWKTVSILLLFCL